MALTAALAALTFAAVGSQAAGRTFAARSITVHGGQVSRLTLLGADAGICRLSITSSDSSTRTFSYQVPATDVQFVLSPPRTVRSGPALIRATCRAGRRHSAAVERLSVRGSRGGRSALLGRTGPYLDIPLPRRLSIGFGGGLTQNPGFSNGQCTYWAFVKRPEIYWTSVAARPAAPRSGWDAYLWARYAQMGGFPEGTTPVVGSIMVNPASHPGSVGHVAYVTAVSDGGHYVTTEMNTYGYGHPDKVYTVWNWSGVVHNPGYAITRPHRTGTIFIYGGPAGPGPGAAAAPPAAMPPTSPAPAPATNPQSSGTPAVPAGTVAETPGGVSRTWSDPATAGGTQGPPLESGQTVGISCKVQGYKVSDGDAWWYKVASAPWNGAYYASADAFYNNGQTSGSLAGTPPVDSAVPDCQTSSPAQSPPTPTPTPTPTPQPQPQPQPTPPPPTWNETPGGVTHTWTNYTNAGGNQGPSIQTSQTVQVYCRIQGFRVADGDTWWYKIATTPWSGAYYASADAFYNNGATSGSLHGTPFYDPAVASC